MQTHKKSTHNQIERNAEANERKRMARQQVPKAN